MVREFTSAAVAVVVGLFAGGAPARAAAPILYSNPHYQSPVEASPDELLLLAGNGLAATDRVVYVALHDASAPPSPPALAPAEASEESGPAPVVSYAAAPYALTVRLPTALRRDRAYALWVLTAGGEWSNAVIVNDLRPLWLTPAFVSASSPTAGLPRELKIVGRNLQPRGSSEIRVRLHGPQSLLLAAEAAAMPLAPYVARVHLPQHLLPGAYRVSLSRDGIAWIDLAQVLTVRADRPAESGYPVADARFGDCRPNDGRDDTACIVAAIAAARAAGGGTVLFGAGTWDLADSRLGGVSPGDGIVVPRGVSLRGMGVGATRIVRAARWSAAGPTVGFSLLGDNRVSDLTFADAQHYGPGDVGGGFLQLGENSDRVWNRTHASAAPVDDVVITHDRFDKTDVAIQDGGTPIERLFVTYNEFGAYRYHLELGGNGYNVQNRFRIDDSVIAHNVFKPGSFLDVANKLGSIASEIGASYRLDFSENLADGAAIDYLYSPGDARGWRAAFFWSLNDDQEMLLVSQNTATCTGDKIGDGEAFSFDNNGNTFAFDSIRRVVAADAASVTVHGPLVTRQHGRDIPVASYYVGHWLQVGDGPGLGQARKITGYEIDAGSGTITFHVAPAWDVVPAREMTRISVGREFWQAFLVGNRVDHRTPLCRKSNRSRSAGGSISIWAQLADTVVAANEQYDTDGIVFDENYKPGEPPPCGACGAETFYDSAFTIRDNLIEGRYDSASDCLPSGITGWLSAAPTGADPPTLGFGVDIAHNRIVGADNSTGAAIAMSHGWFDGPPPQHWPIMDTLLIQHNVIRGIEGPARAGAGCTSPGPRRGIALPAWQLAWNTLLYANACPQVQQALGPPAWRSVAVCPDSTPDSCQCRSSPTAR